MLIIERIASRNLEVLHNILVEHDVRKISVELDRTFDVLRHKSFENIFFNRLHSQVISAEWVIFIHRFVQMNRVLAS